MNLELLDSHAVRLQLQRRIGVQLQEAQLQERILPLSGGQKQRLFSALAIAVSARAFRWG